MKKLSIMIASLMIAAFSQGQVFLYQGFGSGYWPPPGWTPLPLGSHWSLSQTDNAGGLLPEARFDGFDYNGTVRLISPGVDMTGVDTAVLSFRYITGAEETGAPVMGVSTRSGGGNWNIAWETTVQNLVDPREYEVLLTGTDLDNPDFQLSFFLIGDMNRLRYFFIDDIKLYFPTTTDGKLDEILTPYKSDLPVPVEASIINLGNTTIDQVGVAFVTTAGILHDTLLAGLDLGLYDKLTFQFNRWWVSPFGDYDLKMWISSVNGEEDPYHPNDTLVKTISYNRSRPARRPCFEEFTSSIDAGSRYFSNQLFDWCGRNPFETVVNYAINLPDTGDLYYIPDNDTRKNYYGIYTVPMTFCNGNFTTYIDTNDIIMIYDTAVNLISAFEILSTYTLAGDSIFITTNIFPHETMSGVTVHTMVKENTTTGNNGGSGLEYFHNNVMKMFPDGGYGEQVNFAANMPFNLSFTGDLSNTHIEEYNDIEVVIFIQMDSTREILQSAYAVKDAVYNMEDRLSMITLDGVPLDGFNPDIHNYEQDLPAGTAEPPVVFGIPMYDSAFVLIAQAFGMPGNAVLDVYPQSLGSIDRYVVCFNFITNLDESVTAPVSIYPNPVTDEKLSVSGIDHPGIKLYSLDGKLILEKDECNGDVIDMNGIRPGVYILSLIDVSGNVLLIKKIVVL